MSRVLPVSYSLDPTYILVSLMTLNSLEFSVAEQKSLSNWEEVGWLRCPVIPMSQQSGRINFSSTFTYNNSHFKRLEGLVSSRSVLFRPSPYVKRRGRDLTLLVSPSFSKQTFWSRPSETRVKFYFCYCFVPGDTDVIYPEESNFLFVSRTKTSLPYKTNQ